MLVVIGLFMFGLNRPAMKGNSVPFEPANEHNTPYLGLSLPVALLQSKPMLLEHKLGLTFSIIGRTQEISDNFDTGWANSLNAQNQRPWISLVFSSSDEPAYDASLPAIANGFHDEALRRWADSIHDYGKPVYLTILQHVDRNWVASSAVTNGGIPQDVTRAWTHVQAVFQQEGAHNIAWVWSPADPANDSAYAPPTQTVDLVLLSLINYPNTKWVDPAPAIAAVKAKHPNKPLMLEIGVNGDPVQKADWLHKVGDAVTGNSAIYAVIYHEGSPAPNAKASDHPAWSMDSDTQTHNAVRSLAINEHLRTLIGQAAGGGQ
jgi:hypothetical protein